MKGSGFKRVANMDSGVVVPTKKPRGLIFLRSEQKSTAAELRKTHNIALSFKLAGIGELSHLLMYQSKFAENETPETNPQDYKDVVQGLKEGVYVNVAVYYTPIGMFFRDVPYMNSGRFVMNLDRLIPTLLERHNGIYRSKDDDFRFAPYGSNDDSLLMAVCGGSSIVDRLKEVAKDISLISPRDVRKCFIYLVSLKYDGKLEMNLRGDVKEAYGIVAKKINCLR